MQEFLPFQETVTRKRKYDISQKSIDIPLKFFVFELLYFNGKSYLNEPFVSRRQILNKIIKKSENITNKTIALAAETRVVDSRQIEKEFELAIKDNLEGIMVKKDSGIYQPGARGWNWIKYKKSYATRIGDTIDCVVMGYDTGKGKRVGFGIGAFLVGVYDDKNDQYLTIAKIGTGLTDAEWRQLKIKCEKSRLRPAFGGRGKIQSVPNNYQVDKLMECDLWVKPEIVVEIKADEITVSPVHSAGYALRFPRLIKFRDDKRPQDATSLTELLAIYKKQ